MLATPIYAVLCSAMAVNVDVDDRTMALALSSTFNVKNTAFVNLILFSIDFTRIALDQRRKWKRTASLLCILSSNERNGKFENILALTRADSAIIPAYL